MAPTSPASSRAATLAITVALAEESSTDHLLGAWEQIEHGISALFAGQTPLLIRGMLL